MTGPRMVSEVQLVLGIARAFLYVREHPPGSNAGETVEYFQRQVGLVKGQPWCAAFFSTVGRAAMGPDWRLPMSGGCATLGEKAQAIGLLKAGPAAGAGFLLYYPKLKRYAHVGFCVRESAPGRWLTIEGNTGEGGGREGWGVFERERAFGPNDRFIHWWL